MKWKGSRESDNVEDRRSISGGKVAVGGGIIGIIILLVNVFGGENAQFITPVLEQMQGGQQTQTEAAAPLSKEDEEMGHFVRSVLAKTEDTWGKIFAENGMTYKNPKLVLFKGSVNTACGGASSASGPFYCPGDQKVYMDLGFFEELKSKFGAEGGDFAIAYVIAHEIGHHVQTLLGTSEKMHQAQEGKSQAEANKLSVALELQADFYAGVWAHDNKETLDEGDIEE
ncbi:MAG: neutral zinc metallopeptidase, partial [Flavobacterium sp.]